MACSKEDATSGPHLANDVASGWSAHNPSLTEDKLLHPVRGSNLGNELHDLWIPVAAVTANNEEAAISSLGNGQQAAGDERLAVVWLLKYLDLFAQTRTGKRAHKSERMLSAEVWSARSGTYVPGFWSTKGLKKTSLALMMGGKQTSEAVTGGEEPGRRL